MPMPIASHERAQMERSLRERYEDVKARIAAAARRIGRAPEDILLVAVTKYASIDLVRALVELGHVDLGESRLQALQQRVPQMDEFLGRHRQMSTARDVHPPAKVRWHMIGHLQRNKVKKLLPLVRLVHSVDSLRLAEEIQNHAGRLEDPVEVLVQVNVTGEKQKYGVAPAAARHLVEQIETMMNMRVRGLMCIAEDVVDPIAIRHAFQLCAELFDDIRHHNHCGERFNILSMGMTNDFEIAIECGANVVRVGSAIFGERRTDVPEDDEA